MASFLETLVPFVDDFCPSKWIQAHLGPPMIHLRNLTVVIATVPFVIVSVLF